MTFNYAEHSQRHAVKYAVEYLEALQARARRLADEIERRKQDIINYDSKENYGGRHDYFQCAMNEVQGFTGNIQWDTAMRLSGALQLSFNPDYKPEV